MINLPSLKVSSRDANGPRAADVQEIDRQADSISGFQSGPIHAQVRLLGPFSSRLQTTERPSGPMTSSRNIVWTGKSTFPDRARERARVASPNKAMVMMGEGRPRHGKENRRKPV
jgi:hypothetical protein